MCSSKLQVSWVFDGTNSHRFQWEFWWKCWWNWSQKHWAPCIRSGLVRKYRLPEEACNVAFRDTCLLPQSDSSPEGEVPSRFCFTKLVVILRVCPFLPFLPFLIVATLEITKPNTSHVKANWTSACKIVPICWVLRVRDLNVLKRLRITTSSYQ